MELLIHYIVFTLLWRMSSSIRCFTCVPENNYEQIPLCENFENGEKLVRECEHSTMCVKRETYLDLGNGRTFVSTTRGCASQTMSGNQRKINGKWTPVDTIYEVYEEGCHEEPNLLDRPTKTFNCYCRGDHCNTSYKIRLSNLIILLVPIVHFVRQ